MVVLRSNFIKCVVVGDDAVGKTSMLMNYATNRFPTQHVPSMFDNYAGSVVLEGKEYTLQLIDTADQGISAEARRQIYPGADVFAICFSVVNPDSFKNVHQKWIPEMRDRMGEMPFILVGTQTDLRDDPLVISRLQAENKRPILQKEGAIMAKRLGAKCYIESSPVIESRVRRIINNAMVSVFRPRMHGREAGCTIL